MSEALRREVMSKVKTVVVKVGTQVLSDAAGKLDRGQIASLAEQVNRLLGRKLSVVIVSSGAIGAGMGELGLATRPKTLPELQAVAAVGQSHLIQAYDEEFARFGRRAAQILLTREDVYHRLRYLNTRNTIQAILRFGAVPVINENDTVSVEELELSFTDNDTLAALVTNLLRAELLIMLSNVDGLLDAGGRTVDVVKAMSDEVRGLATSARSERGKGGMANKLRAVEIASAAGEAVVIADGRRANVLEEVVSGQKVGTLFVPASRRMSARKRWIGFGARSQGELHLDAGAAEAVRRRGKSLLPSGIVRVAGEFGRGDIVSLMDPEGSEIGRGLINYDAESTRRIQGKKTSEIARILGSCPYVEVVHRDNLVTFES